MVKNLYRKSYSILLGALAACAVNAAQAQDEAARNYPERPMTAIVSAPGTSIDVIMRLIGEGLHTAWQQPVIIEHKPGASSTIAYNTIARAKPDGHTFGIAVTGMIQTPFLLSSLPYDPYTDLTPVTMLARGANVFVVNESVPANTLQEFIDLVKANPDKYAFGSYGTGTTAHILGETFSRRAGLDLLHAPYKGSSPMMNDVLGGQIPAAFPDVATAMNQFATGRIKPLAITGTQRYPLLPDVPTFAEAGIEGLETYGWYGIFMPAGTPRPVVDKLSREIVRIVRTPEVMERLDALGLQVVASTPDEFAEVMRHDGPVWGKAIEDGGIRIE